MMNYAFYFAYGLVGLWFLFSVYYSIKAYSNFADINKYIFDSIPTVFATLGVFGTFIGIFAALWVFDVNNITSSIPSLLEGLKTAFGTSILGILFSLLFQNFVISIIQQKQEEKEIKESSELAALNKLIDEERNTHKLLQGFSKDIVSAMIGEGDDSLSTQFEKFRIHIVDEIREQSRNIKEMSDNQLKTIKVLGGEEETSLLTQIQRLRNDQNDFAKVVTNILDENNENGLTANLRGLRGEQRELGLKNDSNTKEIITALYTTNEMMEEKFDEFARLLAESNTKALIDAVEKVIGDFNTQLAELINKLVKENFDELNNSVKRLNDWQIENKEQIQRLIEQYRSVSDELKITSETLEKVAGNTDKMVNEESILRKLIDELHAVMIEDRKFQEIINKVEEYITGLRENTDILKDSSRNVSEASGSLVEYINKEETFSTGVEKLIDRLKEIEDIKDINGKFWDDIERNMKQGVSILTEGNEQLLNDIEKLDDQFNNRLNQSFINLDKVLQAMVTEHHRRMSDITDRINGEGE